MACRNIPAMNAMPMPLLWWVSTQNKTSQNIHWPALIYSASLSRLAYKLGGENYNAPAQLVGDFLKDRPSTTLGSVTPSYKPGITLGDLSKALPEFAVAAIREAIPEFDRQIKGYAMADAILTGVETRTSAPICIKRDRDYESVNTRGLYPAGEGAGYAGGILSAAIDGIKVAEALALDILKVPRAES